MAETENVLGISGQMDISDIQSTIDKLCSSLQQIGVNTDALSSRMTKALNEIAKSDEDISSKTQQAMSGLKQAMDEMSKGMQDVLSMIKVAQQHVDAYQSSIAKLNTELNNTPHNSSAYDEITKQLEAQQSALKLAQQDVHDLTEAYNNANEVMGKANATYEALSAATTVSAATGQAQSVTNIEVGASAAAAATATGAEAATHISNAAAATQNAEAEKANIDATKNLTSSLQEYISVASGRAEIERMQSESAKGLRNDIKMYEESIKKIQSTLDSTNFTQKISDATAEIEKQKSKIEKYKEVLANLSPDEDATGEGRNNLNRIIDKAQQKIEELQSQIEGWQQQQQTLNKDLEEYNILLDAAKQIQGGETIIPTESKKISVDVDSTSLGELRTQLDDNKTKLQELQAETDKFNGKSLGDTQKAKLADLNKEIDETKEKISVLQNAIKEKNEDTFVGRLRNKLSELKDKLSEFGSELKDKVTAPFTELGNKISGSSFGQRFSAEFSQVKFAVNDATSSIGNFLTGNSKVKKSLAELSQAMGGLGIPLTGALTGIKAVTKALWKMCLTPVGAVLTVIVLGLKAVQTWMTKSAEGQRVYTKLMAYFGSIAASVTDLIILLGKWIYHCFADNMGPMHAFGKAFVTTFKTAIETVYNLLNGLGTTLKGIFTGKWTTIKEGLGIMWDGIKGIGSTVVNALDASFKVMAGIIGTVKNAFTDTKMQNEARNIIANMGSNAEKAAKNAERQLNAEKEIAESKKHQAELDIQIAENREKIYQLSGQEKLDMIAKTKELMKQKYLAWDEKKANGEIVHHKGVIAAMQEEANLQAEKNSMHAASLKDIAKERELRTAVLRTQAQAAASTRMLTRQEEAARRQLERQGKTADKAQARQTEQTRQAQGMYDDTLYQNDQAREKVITDLEQKLADAKIAAMQEGFARTQAERKRQQEKELRQLQEQEEAAVAAELKRVKAEFDAQNAIRKAKGQSQLQWNPEQEAKDIENTEDVKAIRRMYTELRGLTVNRQVEDERKAEDDLVKAHQSYTDRKIAIDRKYQEDLQAIDAAITEAQKRGDKEREDALQRSRNKRTADYGKEKLQAAFDELKNSPDYVAAFTDIDKASTETLNHLVAKFEEVKEAAASSLNPQDIKTYFDTINGLLDELISRDPIGMAKKLTEQLEKQKKELEDAEQKRDFIKNGGAIIKSVGFDVDTGKFTYEMLSLEEAENNVTKANQKLAHTESLKKKAFEQTLEEVQKLISSFNELGSAIGGEAGQIINLIADIGNFAVTTANSMMSVSETASKAIQTLEKASAILAIISAAIQIISKITSLVKTTDDYYEEFAKKQRDINSLRRSVEEYRTAVLKAQIAEKNWFSSTSLGGLKDAWEEHKNAATDYYNKLYEAQEIYKNKSSGLKKYGIPIATTITAAVVGAFTAGAGAAGILGVSAALGAAAAGAASAVVNYAVTSAQQSALSKISYASGQTAAVNNLRIQTRHKSFWRGQKTADLREWVKDKYNADLFDEEGLINKELAEKVIDEYGGKLQGDTKQTLEELIKLREAYDEYKESLQEYISQTYSPIVDNMSDAIWSWLAEGKDALAQFKQSASQTFADIGKEMIKQMLLKDVFSTFQNDLYKIYDNYAQGGLTDAQLAQQMGAIIGTTIDTFNNNLPSLEAFAEQYRDIMSKYGIDVTGNAEQSASAKGVTSITYDQANYLVNLATARNIALEQGNQIRQLIQLDTTQLRVSTMQIQSDISVMRDIQEQGLTQITRIEVNTRPISEILSVVQDIYKITKDNA